MSDWLKTPIQWIDELKLLLLSETDTEPTTDLKLNQIIEKSSKFPIPFPIETIRCNYLKKKIPAEILEENVNSTYPVIHEYGLFLCAIFLNWQRNFGIKQEYYKNVSLLQLVDRLLNKRAVMFLEAQDRYMLITREKGWGNWESIGTQQEKNPLVLEKCLSYDEIKLSALLSVSSHSYFINDGDRYNGGKFEADRSKIEENGVIVGLIGTRLEKTKVMEYQEIIKSKEQNNHRFYYNGEVPTLQNEFLKFYGGSCKTYEEMESELKSSDRYIDLGGNTYFDTITYERRIAISIDTLLIEANDRAKQKSKKAYIHVVGLGLGVWKICKEQNKIFMDTFAQRLELLSEVLTNVSDVRFAYIRETSAGKYKNGDEINGIKIHIVNSNPQKKLDGDNEGKLLVVSYPWDGNALPGNEFWGGSLSGSGDPAAACSSQVAELHNWYINEKVSARNLRVATSKGLLEFQQYQRLYKGDS